MEGKEGFGVGFWSWAFDEENDMLRDERDERVEPTHAGKMHGEDGYPKETTNTVPDIQKYIIVVIRDGI